MKWNEVLSTLNENNWLKPNEINALEQLPNLRDDIFFPDYLNFGYKPMEFSYSEGIMTNSVIYSLGMELKSIANNRKLLLKLVFKNRDIYNAVISDNIGLLDKDFGWDTVATMDVLNRKRTGIKPILEYRRLSTYQGTLQDRFKSCLINIKSNYDNTARDIISGEYWDPVAIDLDFI